MLFIKLQFIVETINNTKFVFDKMQGQCQTILTIFTLNFQFIVITFSSQNKQNQNVLIDTISLREDSICKILKIGSRDSCFFI